MVGQAIPSVSPFDATDYLHKTECFCFTSQPLDGRGEKVMPLKIIVDQDLPKHINKLTLSYTLFDITNLNKKRTAGPVSPMPSYGGVKMETNDGK